MKNATLGIFALILFLNINLLAAPSRVMIIRHAEKPANDSDPDLSPDGYKRAHALTELFNIHPEYASKGLPSHIFAAKYVPGQNANRAIETITPLAKVLGLPVEIPNVGSETQELSDRILNNHKYDGKVVLISWTHGNIPKLANALGGNCAKKWDGSVFDRVWMLEYSDSEIECSDLPESVLPGDSN